MYNTHSHLQPLSDSHDIKNSFSFLFAPRRVENEIDISHHKLNNNYSQKCVLNANHFVGNNGILNRYNENGTL